MMWDEPVRGTIPDPSFASLSGLERGRAYLRGEVGRPPFSRLTGIRLTQVSTGSASLTMRFADRGRHQLKGIEGEWQLHALSD